MRLADYLVDTSALVRLLRNAELRVRWKSPLTAGLIAVCPVVELEFLYTARSVADRDWLQRSRRFDQVVASLDALIASRLIG